MIDSTTIAAAPTAAANQGHFRRLAGGCDASGGSGRVLAGVCAMVTGDTVSEEEEAVAAGRGRIAADADADAGARASAGTAGLCCTAGIDTTPPQAGHFPFLPAHSSGRFSVAPHWQ
jgi:hypothetical protein